MKSMKVMTLMSLMTFRFLSQIFHIVLNQDNLQNNQCINTSRSPIKNPFISMNNKNLVHITNPKTKRRMMTNFDKI